MRCRRARPALTAANYPGRTALHGEAYGTARCSASRFPRLSPLPDDGVAVVRRVAIRPAGAAEASTRFDDLREHLRSGSHIRRAIRRSRNVDLDPDSAFLAKSVMRICACVFKRTFWPAVSCGSPMRGPPRLAPSALRGDLRRRHPVRRDRESPRSRSGLVTRAAKNVG